MDKLAHKRNDSFVRSELFLQGAFEANNAFTDFLKELGLNKTIVTDLTSEILKEKTQSQN
jgi:hypothetical protein